MIKIYSVRFGPQKNPSTSTCGGVFNFLRLNLRIK